MRTEKLRSMSPTQCLLVLFVFALLAGPRPVSVANENGAAATQTHREPAPRLSDEDLVRLDLFYSPIREARREAKPTPPGGIAALLKEEATALSNLEARQREAGDEETFLSLQDAIDRLRLTTEVRLLEHQAAHARAAGRLALARETERAASDLALQISRVLADRARFPELTIPGAPLRNPEQDPRSKPPR